MPSIDEIRELLKNMSKEDRLLLIQMCNNENNKEENKDFYNQLSNNHHCPHCHSNKICKNGFAGKYQQFRCNACKKNYTIRTKTIWQNTHKSIEIWQEYIELFSQGLALRKIVEKMDNKINLKTAFYWRHKILKFLSKNNDDGNNKLGGIVEADETFFEESQKGSRKMTRKPRKRGYSSYVGDKKTKICVLTAIDRNKTSFTKPVGFGGLEKDDVILLQRHLTKDSVLITDGNRTYKNLNNVKLKSLKFGKPENKVYHLNNINNFHSMLKKFMTRFNGVATKYIDFYMNYFREFRAKADIMAELIAMNGFYRVADVKAKRVCFEKIVNL